MKSLPWLLGLVALLALLALLWGAHVSRQMGAAQTTKDSVLAVNTVLREQNAAIAAHGDSADRFAQRRASEAKRWGRVADSLTTLLHTPAVVTPPDTTVRDSLRFYRETTDTLLERLDLARRSLEARQNEVGGLRVALDSQKAATGLLRAAFQNERSRADSLASVLRKMPVGCRRVPILGVPLPQVGIGYALSAKGLAPAVAVVIPIGGC